MSNGITHINCSKNTDSRYISNYFLTAVTNQLKEGRACFGPWFEGRIGHCVGGGGGGTRKDLAVTAIRLCDSSHCVQTPAAEMNTSAQFTFSFLLILGSQSMECATHRQADLPISVKPLW